MKFSALIEYVRVFCAAENAAGVSSGGVGNMKMQTRKFHIA
jgi:hypothetical protein